MKKNQKYKWGVIQRDRGSDGLFGANPILEESAWISRKSAIELAESKARKNPDKEFVVFQIVAVSASIIPTYITVEIE